MRTKLLACLVFISSQPLVAIDSPFYGTRDIDYWEEGKELVPIDDRFWERYFNHSPYNDLFWDQGSKWGKPPLIYRIAVTNPTRENVLRWLKWNDEHRRLFANFHTVLKSIEKEREQKSIDLKIPKKIMSKTDVFYFYSGSCTACREDVKNTAQLKRYVRSMSFINVDSESDDLHPGSYKYSKTLKMVISKKIDGFSISETPTIFLKYNNRIVKTTGVTTIESYSNLLKSLALKGGS